MGGIKMASRCFQVVRQFSSSAVRAKLVQPPIQVFGTEGRYATALYSAASKQGQLDKVLNGFLSKGESLLLTTEVDPSIIGGMKIQIADKYVDMSMASKIKAYTDLIKQAV